MSDRFRLLYVYEERIPEDLKSLVAGSFPTEEFEIRRMTYVNSPDEMRDLLGWAEGVLFGPGRHLDDAVLQAAGHIKLMQLWSSGYDKFNTVGCAKYGIPVANNGGANAISVAEHTIGLMLAVSKWLPDSHRRTVEGRWGGNSHGMDMFVLNEKTLGIVGFGNIGRHVGRIAAAFGMKVMYHDLVRAPDEVERALGARLCALDDLLSESDYVTLNLHLNEQTRDLLGDKRLALMKGSAVLINVSRAGLVDTKSLSRRLEGGEIWGAALDVYDSEPTSPGDPLLTHPRVVATPHMAGSTRDAYITSMKHAIENFRRVRDGKQPRWVVNGVGQS